ncbi:hypothetical protein GQ600_13305 [Phytophthora cactorum]|nr:hypothetical protein GQ600_13305 [Phytophthora cactorum]
MTSTIVGQSVPTLSPGTCNVFAKNNWLFVEQLKGVNVQRNTISTDAKACGDLAPLLCVRVVCRDGAEALQLPHVVETLSAFLDWSPKWTLARACNINSLRLVRRLLQQPADNIWRSQRSGRRRISGENCSRKESKHGGELE